MRRQILALSVALFTAGLLPPGGTEKASAQTFRMRIQSSVPTSATQFEGLQKFAERLAKMSGGRLKVEPFPVGAIVGLSEILDATDKGVVEAGYAWAHAWSGKHPAGTLFGSAPLDQTVYFSWLYAGGGNELLRAYYRDALKTKVVGFALMGVGPDALGWFKAPFRTMDDLKRIRFRVPPGVPGEIYRHLGVPAVSLPGPEIIPAAQRGAIDAAEWGYPSDDMAFGFHQVWKNYYLQGLHQVSDVGDLIINEEFWKKLPPDLQAMIETATLAINLEHYALLVQRNGAALKQLVEKEGVRLINTPPEYFAEFPKATRQVMERYAARDPFFKKVWESQRQFTQLIYPFWINNLKTNMFLVETVLREK
ncbi:MAG: TRAP transporter substrate-binding protein [Candidatus Rokubacteria bacterium]|nr:TRAP transporter substrate-binding protein [Candidatus Rokubacteria bacterium]